jgi:hypothetical protein
LRIKLHIERLSLEGLPLTRNQGAAVQTAVESELTRMLSERGLADGIRAGGAMPSLPAVRLEYASGASPAQLGRQIARAVYGGIGKAK